MSLVMTNAILVLPDTALPGMLHIVGDRIADVQPGYSRLAGAIDFEGDFLLPGAVDVHTDNLERQVQPRSNARWPSRSAMLAHDAHCAASGITTVLDALCVGDLGFDEDRLKTCDDGVADLEALAPAGLLRAEHFLHLRCELPAEGMLERLDRMADHKLVRMVSLMDHTPGTGQYADLVRYRAMRRNDGEAPADIDRRIFALQAQQARLRGPNRAALLARLRGHCAALASHDDRTRDDIAENIRDGIAVSEFPVTREAAFAARQGGMAVIAGAPNLVRGGSHTGNVAGIALLRDGLVDALASDYVPASLVEGAFVAARDASLDVPAAIRLISDAPARMVGFDDRGRIEPGLRADLVRVRLHEGVPVVRQVWRAGERVM